ncbi:MAG: hypothetical protein IJA12_05915 [Oscillospiraceae bacterium]|nr:hypothetical protein [Oscillospiraceae bacterium]
MFLIGMKNTDDFLKLKEQAWNFIIGNGDFNIDDFGADEYKYFDKLLQLYGKLNDGEITKEEAVKLDEKNYAEYESSVDAHLGYIQDRKELEHNRMTAYDEIAKCEKSDDILVMFSALAKAVGLMTGDKSFAGRQERKLNHE